MAKSAKTLTKPRLPYRSIMSAPPRGYRLIKRSVTTMKAVEVRPTSPWGTCSSDCEEGGILVRTGHTEATVDLMNLAGLKPCGLCCEIMADNGEMMRTTELLKFARHHGLTVLTIADLISYRLRNDTLVSREATAEFPCVYGDFTIYGYVNKLNGEHHVALTLISPTESRCHSCALELTGTPWVRDAVMAAKQRRAMRMIAKKVEALVYAAAGRQRHWPDQQAKA